MVEESFDPIVVQSQTENFAPVESIPEKRPVMALVAGLWRSGIEVSKIEWKDGYTTPQTR